MLFEKLSAQLLSRTARTIEKTIEKQHILLNQEFLHEQFVTIFFVETFTGKLK